MWILTNKKDEKRRGTIQLIDATSMKSLLKKNIGEKNSEITPSIRRTIVDLYLAYRDADPKYSMVFPNEEFGYYAVDVQRPLRLKVDLTEEKIEQLLTEGKDNDLITVVRNYLNIQKTESVNSFNSFINEIEKVSKDAGVKLTAKRKKLLRDYLTYVSEDAEPVIDSKGNIEPDKNLKDSEQIPMLYEGGIEGFLEKEIKPYVPDAWIDEKSASIGYELSFTKYFYKPVDLRPVEDIIEDLRTLEKESDGVLAGIMEDFER